MAHATRLRQVLGIVAGASVYYESPQFYNGNEKLPPAADGQYLTDLFAEHAAGYVAEMAQKKQPFFLYTAFNAPHWPIQAPEEDVRKYAKRYAGGWDALREERHKKQIAMGIVSPKWPLTPRDPRVPAWDKVEDKEWEMRRMAVYAAMIDRLDKGIGRIIDQVEKAGIADNTLIVFMSDNGGNSEEINHPNRNGAGKEGARAATAGAHADKPCEIGMPCAGNVPGLMPGSRDTFESIGIPWGNRTNPRRNSLAERAMYSLEGLKRGFCNFRGSDCCGVLRGSDGVVAVNGRVSASLFRRSKTAPSHEHFFASRPVSRFFPG